MGDFKTLSGLTTQMNVTDKKEYFRQVIVNAFCFQMMTDIKVDKIALVYANCLGHGFMVERDFSMKEEFVKNTIIRLLNASDTLYIDNHVILHNFIPIKYDTKQWSDDGSETNIVFYYKELEGDKSSTPRKRINNGGYSIMYYARQRQYELELIPMKLRLSEKNGFAISVLQSPVKPSIINVRAAFHTYGKELTPYERGLRYRSYPKEEDPKSRARRKKICARINTFVKSLVFEERNSPSDMFERLSLNWGKPQTPRTYSKHYKRGTSRESWHDKSEWTPEITKEVRKEKVEIVMRALHRELNTQLKEHIINTYIVNEESLNYFNHMSQRPFWQKAVNEVGRIKVRDVITAMYDSLKKKDYIK
jgi:hypothetical protein